MAKRLSVLELGRKQGNVITETDSPARMGRELCSVSPLPLLSCGDRGSLWGLWGEMWQQWGVGWVSWSLCTAQQAWDGGQFHPDPAPASAPTPAPRRLPPARAQQRRAEGCNAAPFLLIDTSLSLSHRRLWMLIFSCRYFPQANFSVTFHPFSTVSGCYFLPPRCFLFQI